MIDEQQQQEYQKRKPPLQAGALRLTVLVVHAAAGLVGDPVAVRVVVPAPLALAAHPPAACHIAVGVLDPVPVLELEKVKKIKFPVYTIRNYKPKVKASLSISSATIVFVNDREVVRSALVRVELE